MGGIKDVGAKPVSTQQTESSKPQTPAGSAQPSPAEATSQPLTQEGKSAKTMESGIAGEAMRQKVMLAAEAGSAIAGIGGLVAAQKGIGAAAAKAAKSVLQKAQSNQVMSPSGVPYKPEARVPDNTPIFTGGKIDREKVLQSLSQHDQNAKTTEDKDRCGGTAAIASAINSGGDAGLLKLTKAMKSNLPAKSLKELNEIEEKIKNKTATHGDLGRLS